MGDFFAGEFNAFNYDSSSGASEDQIYDASLLPSKSYKKEIDCFEPLPFYFDQISSVTDEIDFNNLDKDVDLELEEDCDDLMSTFSSLCSEDDIDYDFEQEFSDESQLESTSILVDNIFSNSCGIKSKHCNTKIEPIYAFSGFTQMPTCRTNVSKSA